MPWIQFKVSDAEYERMKYYAMAKDLEGEEGPGNLARHATRHFMRQYRLRESEIEALEQRLKEGPKD